jgi:hypothetical protein
VISFALFIVRFLDVFGSAMQQQNVIGRHWWAIPLPSGIRSLCIYAQTALVALETIGQPTPFQVFISIIAMWAAATLGTWAGMIAHDRLFRKTRKRLTPDM